MRLRFQETPYDLITAAAAAISLLGLVVTGAGGPVRIVLALAFVLLLPGYSVLAALFPRDGEMGWIRRIALSVGLSIACVALLGLLLDLTPWGVGLETVTASLLLFSLGLIAVAWWRRLRVPAQGRLELSVELARPRWRDLTISDRILAIGVVLALTSGVGAVAYGLANPPAPDRFTDFYILASDGRIHDAPLSLNATEQGLVIVGVRNREGRPMNYTVQVRLVVLDIVFNSSSGRNETIEQTSVILDEFSANVSSGATWEERYPFAIVDTGEYRLRFFLFVGASQADAYRVVDIRIHVT